MAIKSSALSSKVRPLAGGFRARAARGAASERAGLRFPKDYLSVLDFDAAGFAQLLELGARLKVERRLGRRAPTAQALAGRHVALLFDKPSLRTRATFEIAVHELGGDVIAPPQEGPLGGRETVADVARNLERWVSCVVVRTFGQDRVVELAESAPRLHVINALTNEEHPCQAAADLLTLRDRWGGSAAPRAGGPSPTSATATTSPPRSCRRRCSRACRCASPRRRATGCQPPSARARSAPASTAPRSRCSRTRPRPSSGVDAVYTDVWTSMGKENEAANRLARFRPYQVNAALMKRAKPDAVFMHCLPAHRGDEVTDEVMDGPASVVFDQSENRLHAQKALLLLLVA